MSVENTLRDSSQDQPYAPPPGTETLVRNAGDLAVQTTGTGSSEVVPRQQFQSTSQSMQGTQTPVDAKSAGDLLNSPLLVQPQPVPEHVEQNVAQAITEGLFAPLLKKEEEDEDHVSLLGHIKTLSDLSNVSKSSQTSSTSATENQTESVTPLTNMELASLSTLRSSLTTKDDILITLKKLLPASITITPDMEAELGKIAEGIFNNKNAISSPLFSNDSQKVARELAKFSSMSEVTSQLATGLSELNKKLDADLSSTNKIIQEKALRALASFSSPDDPASVAHQGLNAKEAKQVGNYLHMLAAILAFLSELRATISILESDYGKTTTQAKLETQKKMTEMALAKYETSLSQIKATAEKNLEQIEAAEAAKKKAKMWGILGPIITAVMTIIAVVVTVLSAGTLGPAMTAAIVAATVAMAALTICDQTMGVMDKLCDVMGISKENRALRAFVKFAAMAVIVIATCGTGAASAAAGTVTRAATMMVMMMVVQSLFQSGLVTEMFVAIAKACGKSDEEAAMIAMICTVILMLLMILAMAKAAGSTAQQGAQAGDQVRGRSSAVIEEVAESSQQVAIQQVDDATATAQTTASTASSAGSSLGSTASSSANQAAGQAQEQAQSLIRRVLEGIKARVQEATVGSVLTEVVRLLNLIAGCLKASADISQAKAQKGIAEATEEQAALTQAAGELNAVLEYLQSLTKGFDTAINKMIGQGGDVQQINELVKSFFDLFKQTVESAQAILNKATR
jgi:hypothetical protein